MVYGPLPPRNSDAVIVRLYRLVWSRPLRGCDAGYLHRQKGHYFSGAQARANPNDSTTAFVPSMKTQEHEDYDKPEISKS